MTLINAISCAFASIRTYHLPQIAVVHLKQVWSSVDLNWGYPPHAGAANQQWQGNPHHAYPIAPPPYPMHGTSSYNLLCFQVESQTRNSFVWPEFCLHLQYHTNISIAHCCLIQIFFEVVRCRQNGKGAINGTSVFPMTSTRLLSYLW